MIFTSGSNHRHTTPKNVRLRSIHPSVPAAACCIARNTKLILNLRFAQRSDQNVWSVKQRLCVGQRAAQSLPFGDDWFVAAAHVPSQTVEKHNSQRVETSCSGTRRSYGRRSSACPPFALRRPQRNPELQESILFGSCQCEVRLRAQYRRAQLLLLLRQRCRRKWCERI